MAMIERLGATKLPRKNCPRRDTKGHEGEKTRMEDGGWRMEGSFLLSSILHLLSPPPTVLVFLRVPSWAILFFSRPGYNVLDNGETIRENRDYWFRAGWMDLHYLCRPRQSQAGDVRGGHQ